MTTTMFRRLVFQTGRALGIAIVVLACVPAFATTFTTNTGIGVGNTNYDGTDIVVTNCTLTVDGAHSFSSIHVEAGGALTHSFFPSGTVSNLLFITNESQVLSGTNPVTLLNSNALSTTVVVTDSSGTNVYTNGLDYLLTPSGALTQLQRTTNSSIPDGGIVLVSYDSLLGVIQTGLTLTVTNNVQVDAGGAIVANGTGYGGGLGIGPGNHSSGSSFDGSGGGYGGYGGMSSSNAVGGACYGSYAQPMNLGSGGGASYIGAGGPGGGLIEITAGGTVIDNGLISANGGNGTNSRSGGGSGGSVWITALALSGSGTITANGGSGEPTHGGGGGGGRIAIQYGASSFEGTVSAYGGTGANTGGAGTVYTKMTGQNGFLVIDNGGQSGTNTLLAITDPTLNVFIQGSAGVMPSVSWNVGVLTIASNSFLLAYPMTTLNLTAAGAITIEAGGGVMANAAGYGANSGSGAGRGYSDSPYYPCGGGGYGGNGALNLSSGGTGGAAYGSQSSPSSLGSGGGSFSPYSLGGSGGGAIQITAFGGIVQVDGTLSANGSNGSGSGGGGGSGGSIWLTGGTLLGSGTISANGGAGANSVGGGGGGGRILLDPQANVFDGTISAFGGVGVGVGGAGTILLEVSGQNQNAQLILDNGGNLGTNTPVQSQSSSTDLIVRNGAIGSSSSSVTFANLYLDTNGWLIPALNNSPPAYALNFSFTGNATIKAGSGVIADFVGYGPGTGSGDGRFLGIGPTYPCSGAGHGGYGGGSAGNSATGGITYDSSTAPVDPGSGGGTDSPYSFGGPGGGVIRLNVSGTLEMDGIISANGGNGSGAGGGGGSGGSIWLAVGTLSGGGYIAANGGSGADATGGGGGGGMVYIPCNNNSFSGTITAYGGGGANWGGAGPTVVQVTGQHTQLILDNGGHAGPATPLPSSTTTDLTLRNGAVGLPPTSMSLGNLLISSNSSLFVSNGTFYVASFSCANATIQAGGAITADLMGYGAGLGSGDGHGVESSPYYPCSGGGHGGNGGNSLGNLALGGGSYDSATSPSSFGSGGGVESPYSSGGAGGGAFSLTVSGLLQVNGSISANGGNGSGLGGGGGAGGAIKITAGTLTGSGSIAANGGNGAGSIGGGGGGGCIAIYPSANQFSGTISAYGGGGANWGGAGTLYIQTTGQTPQLILDNNGQAGAATPAQSVPTGNLILRNGAVGYPSSQGETFTSLLVSSNTWLKALTNGSSAGIVSLTVNGNATVQTGGGIVTDNSLSSAGGGLGAGHYGGGSPNYPCSGAGYGGYGANSSGSGAGGGSVYGSITSPSAAGSGGGTEYPYSIGGAGGGSIHLTVNGALDVDGIISANGGNGTGIGGGGGSGGSIWLTVTTLAGAGSIAANGGNGAGTVGGGGGGGRISIGYTSDSFVGTIVAYGGGGYGHGGAGTIYTKASSQSVGQLIVNNGGAAGANTLLSSILGAPSLPFNLTIGNGASVSPQGGFPLLGNLTIASGGLLTVMANQSNLDLLVFSNLDVAPGGVIAVDGEGFAPGGGPGAGQSIDADGSGAGYGGTGGASSTAPGGASYGSSNQPVDFGSGGGLGDGPLAGGSAGGGAARLSVGGILTVDGEITANGQTGLQDNSGGGSGGSLWVTAGTLAGSGLFAANGGAGELYGGGGGAGGRIALYSRGNSFFGLATVFGATGESSGANGTIYSNTIPRLQVLSNSPVGIVSNGVSSVVLYFNDAPNPNLFSATAVSLLTPNGPLLSNSISIAMLSSVSYQVSFPLQTAVGNYTVTVGPNIYDLYGQPMLQAYAGAFTISLPVIQGTIVDTNGLPVPGVVLQPSVAYSYTTTDTNGNYSLGFVPGATFTVTPSLGNLIFVPPSLSYSNITASVSNQNYLAVPSIAPILTATGNATNFVLGWRALPGLSYQIYCSTNLINWIPYGNAITGSNGPVQLVVPLGGAPMQFYSVQSSN
jgi:hypothetical protein